MLPAWQRIRWSQVCNLYGSISWEKTTWWHRCLFNGSPGPDVACSFCRDFISDLLVSSDKPTILHTYQSLFYSYMKWSCLTHWNSRTIIQDSQKNWAFRPVPRSWLQWDIHTCIIKTNDGRIMLLQVKILKGCTGGRWGRNGLKTITPTKDKSVNIKYRAGPCPL